MLFCILSLHAPARPHHGHECRCGQVERNRKEPGLPGVYEVPREGLPHGLPLWGLGGGGERQERQERQESPSSDSELSDSRF